MKVNIKLLNEYAKVPTRGSEDAAGYDLYAAIPEIVAIPPRGIKRIGSGVSIELPKGTFGGIFARSGLAAKEGLRPANCVGVCDSDYRGEYITAVFNDSDETRYIHPGDRIAQLVILPFVSVEFNEVNELSDTERGDGGFGHTGK